MPNTQTSRGYIVALVASLALSTTAVFIRYLTETYQLPALVLAFWRAVFVTLTVLAFLLLAKPHLLKQGLLHLKYLFIYGFVLAVFNSFWTLSVALNGAGIATVLAYSSAGFTALLGWWLLKEKLGWVKVLAVILSLGGCVLVSGALDASLRQANPVGIFTGTLTGLFYAAYSLMGRSAAQRGLDPWTTLLYTFAFDALFLLIFNLVSGGVIPGAASRPFDLLWLGNAWEGWGVLFLLAAGPTVAGFWLYNTSLSLLPSSVANLILTTEPVFTAMIAFIFLGERLAWVQIGGGLLILLGVVFLRVFEDKAKGSVPEDALV